MINLSIMEDYGENQALLMPEFNEHSMQYGVHSNTNTRDCSHSDDESCHSDDWWDGSASSSCSSCNSDLGSEADWESQVDDRGELLYIESNMPVVSVSTAASENSAGVDEAQNKGKKKTARGKLVRLIRRRSSRRSVRRKPQVAGEVVNDKERTAVGSGKVTFRDSQEGEVRTVRLKLAASDNLGRRATLCESLLGLVISTFADGTRIMIAGFVPNSEAMKHRGIKIGDWLRYVNGQEVTFQMIDPVLRIIRSSNEVELKLQRVAACDITAHVTPSIVMDENSRKDNVYQSELVKRLVWGESMSSRCEGEEEELLVAPFSVMYLTHEGLTEDGPPDEGVLFSWPPPQQRIGNALYETRGAFITLHHLLLDLSRSPPVSTTLEIRGRLTHVIYTPEGSELLLFCVPNSRCTLGEACQLNADVVRCLRFNYQTLSRCFKAREHLPTLERLFNLVWAALLGAGEDPGRCHPDAGSQRSRFEQLSPAAHYIPLPRDAQMQIDDAFSELEANDFGSYNEDHHGGRRLYSIIGSSLYHKGYLLGSHLSGDDTMDVNAWLRENGLLRLSRLEPVRSLVTWTEVYPLSCNRGLPSSQSSTAYPLPQGRWFLLVVGQGYSLLGVLLEAGGCTVMPVGAPGPDLYYVQQAQATLRHLHKIGVPALAEKWMSDCVRPQVVAPDTPTKVSPKRLQLDNSAQAKLSDSTQKLSNLSNSSSKKLQEVTSILKHRNSPNGGNTYPQTNIGLAGLCETSEDSARSSVVSDEVAPILGRRAERERATSASDTNSHSRLTDSDLSDDDDSDWAYTDQRRTLYGSRAFDPIDLGRTLLSDVNYTIPSSLVAGAQNTLFHYVQLDTVDGILLGPPVERERPQFLSQVLNRFRSSAQSIHGLLQNTVRFKRLKGQEVHESLINKSLVAIKEHGILFEMMPNDSDTSTPNKKAPAPLNFWVIGRLFFVPHPREVYVCFQESAPQNMVEIAFRLALSASG